MRESFHWDDKFLTGLPEVDTQHRHLVELINQFGDSLSRSGTAARVEVESLFADLADYARFHFAAEESLMAEVGIDPRHVERQGQQHAGFVRQLIDLRAQNTLGTCDDCQAVLKFLVRWLVNHILGTDQIMGRQVIAIRAGMSPEEAYRLIEPNHDEPVHATEPLVDALSDLYQEVAARNRELLALNQSLEHLVESRTAELSQANQRLEAMVMTDHLTRLPNRRHAIANLEMHWEIPGQPLACLLIDADGFKQVNDTWGHAAGDAVLIALANCLRDSVRSDDLACRLGGDEFMVLCPNTDLDGALRVGEQLRAQVHALRVPAGDGAWEGSISVGVAARLPGMGAPDDLIKAADDGVYLAKRRGRNGVATAQREPAVTPT